MSADTNQHHHQDQHPTPPGSRPADPEMTNDQRTLTTHRAAVRGNLAGDPGDIGHAARTLRHAIGVADYACLDVPAEVRAAAEHLDRWHAQVKRQLDAERAEREATGITALAQQAAIEQAWHHRPAEPTPGREAGHER
jgi:hypothetical protein